MSLNRFTVDYRVRVLKWPRHLAETLPPGAANRLAITVAERVWDVLSGMALPTPMADLREALPDLPDGVLNTTLSREHKRGTVRRVRVGHYVLTPKGHERLAACKAWRQQMDAMDDDDEWTPPAWVHPYRRTAA